MKDSCDKELYTGSINGHTTIGELKPDTLDFGTHTFSIPDLEAKYHREALEEYKNKILGLLTCLEAIGDLEFRREHERFNDIINGFQLELFTKLGYESFFKDFLKRIEKLNEKL